MMIREKLRNPFVQQYLLEILLPLVGYFFFDWTILILAAFYLVDQLSGEISFLRKYRAIMRYEKLPHHFQMTVAIILFAVIISVEVISMMYYFKNPVSGFSVSFYPELITFCTDELWLLLPVVLLMYYFKDQLTFFIPRRFTTKNGLGFFKWHLIGNAIIATLVAVGFLAIVKFPMDELILIIIFLILKIGYDFTFGKYSERMSDKP